MRATGPTKTAPSVMAGRMMLMKAVGRPDRAVAALEGQQAGAADILDQQQADPEDRHRHAHHRERHDGAIDQRAAPAGRQRAERDAERHRPDEAGEHQLDGRPEGEARSRRRRRGWRSSSGRGRAAARGRDSGRTAPRAAGRGRGRWRIASTSALVAVGPATTVAGSVGTTCSSRKPISSTPSRTGSEIINRWAICRAISSKPAPFG